MRIKLNELLEILQKAKDKYGNLDIHLNLLDPETRTILYWGELSELEVEERTTLNLYAELNK